MSVQSIFPPSASPHYLDAAIAMIPNSAGLLADFLSKFGDIGSGAAMRREAFYRDWPLLPHDWLILGFWQTYSPQGLCDRQIILLESVLDKLADVEAHRDLAPALRGDTAAAISAALRLLPIRKPDRRVHLVMSAVFLSAVRGCPAAALVLSHVLGRLQVDEALGRRLAASGCKTSHLPQGHGRNSDDQ